MNCLAYMTQSSLAPNAVALTSRTVQELDEALLVEQLLANDAAAWREFSARYSRLMLSCISRVTARFGRVGADDIREIYGMLCLQLLSHDKKKLRSFEPGRGTRLGSWLGLLATHTAYDFLRSIRRTPRFDELSGAESIATDLPDPSEKTLQLERARLVERALAGLTEKDRTFVELYYVQGLSPEDVALQMGISVKTVYSKKHKLQSRLESLLSSEQLAA